MKAEAKEKLNIFFSEAKHETKAKAETKDKVKANGNVKATAKIQIWNEWWN